MNLDIIKAKLARGGQMNGGEIKLVVADIVKLFEAQQEKINALEEALDALARRSDRGSKKSSQTSEVRSETDE
jgi:hypothetical protein